MTLDEVLNYFGSGAAIGRELGLCRTTYNTWRMRGYIPRMQQYRIERITEGKLTMDVGIRQTGRSYGTGIPIMAEDTKVAE